MWGFWGEELWTVTGPVMLWATTVHTFSSTGSTKQTHKHEVETSAPRVQGSDCESVNGLLIARKLQRWRWLLSLTLPDARADITYDFWPAGKFNCRQDIQLQHTVSVERPQSVQGLSGTALLFLFVLCWAWCRRHREILFEQLHLKPPLSMVWNGFVKIGSHLFFFWLFRLSKNLGMLKTGFTAAVWTKPKCYQY